MYQIIWEDSFQKDYDLFVKTERLKSHIADDLHDAMDWALGLKGDTMGMEITNSGHYVWVGGGLVGLPLHAVVYQISGHNIHLLRLFKVDEADLIDDDFPF